MKNKKNICPLCEVEGHVEEITITKELLIREVPITIKNVRMMECKSCDSRWQPTGCDYMNDAFNVYRELTGMLTPDKIKEVMKLSNTYPTPIIVMDDERLRQLSNGALATKEENEVLQQLYNKYILEI